MNTRTLFALVVILAVSAVMGTVTAENGQKQKLYVLSSAGDDAIIIDPATNQITGSLKVGGLPHGLAIPESQDVVYFVTEADNKIVVVDPVTDEILGKYPVGDSPNEPDITPDGRFVYIPARHLGVYEVFDTEKKEIVARIRTKGLPHNAVASPDGRFMYLSPQGDNDLIYVADTKTHTVHATINTEHGAATDRHQSGWQVALRQHRRVTRLQGARPGEEHRSVNGVLRTVRQGEGRAEPVAWRRCHAGWQGGLGLGRKSRTGVRLRRDAEPSEADCQVRESR